MAGARRPHSRADGILSAKPEWNDSNGVNCVVSGATRTRQPNLNKPDLNAVAQRNRAR